MSAYGEKLNSHIVCCENAISKGKRPPPMKSLASTESVSSIAYGMLLGLISISFVTFAFQLLPSFFRALPELLKEPIFQIAFALSATLVGKITDFLKQVQRLYLACIEMGFALALSYNVSVKIAAGENITQMMLAYLAAAFVAHRGWENWRKHKEKQQNPGKKEED